MTSVADIPHGDDADDELSGISPELVLVDPDLARIVRERETSLGAPALPPARRPSPLRLVPASEIEPPIVPRSAPSEPPAAEEPDPGPVVDAEPIAAEPTAPPPPPVPDAAAAIAAEVSERVVEAEPARAVDPPRRPIPAPLAEPARRPTVTPSPVQARSAAAALGAATEPVMPHPVKRTSTAPRRAPVARSAGRGRRVLALLGGVAAASVAVLALLQLTGGPSETARTGAGPQAKSSPSAARKTAPKPKPAAKTVRPATKTQAKTKPKAQARPTATGKARTAPKPSTAAATRKSTVEPKQAEGSAKPKAPVTAKQQPATRPKTAAPAPTPKPATTKPAKAAPGAGAGAPPATRRFAWAPVAGAIGYHVELFKGTERVLVQETKEPVLELGASWRYQGRTVTLTPGAYRWYVWPVTKSGRATQAVVQAKLTV